MKTKTMSTPLTFGELKAVESFISFPVDGDDSGHGGFRKGGYLFAKKDSKSAIRLVDGNNSTFPKTMEVLLVIL